MNFELALIPVLPLAGFLILALFGERFSARAVAWVGSGSVGLSALAATHLALAAFSTLQAGAALRTRLWTWWSIGDVRPGITFSLDALSLIFVLVITIVGFLIHVYSTEYMRGDPSYRRFFACMNLFVAAMLILVLADDLLLLYLGWEGVGLCSYLLIGFWYQDPANGRAANKAFLVTRVGDTLMAIGLFLLFWNLDSLRIPVVLERAPAAWPLGSATATAIALLLLGGAVGKSAQIPLQTWLPDAMAGPTPVSALIHAATMVTAGVYLIARMNPLFALSPAALTTTAWIGAITLLIAGASALVQSDIKRVLAYSTISQIGYMFLALGVGAWPAAVFHFMTHACFKALLFLGAGVVILALHHAQEIDRMGGLRKGLPITFRTFLVGAASLAAFPLVTSGFYSKDLILWEAWSSPGGNHWLWAAGLVGAVITALYALRLVLRVFTGAARSPHDAQLMEKGAKGPKAALLVPLVVLAVLALFAGLLEVPATLGGNGAFTRFVSAPYTAHIAAAHPPAPEGSGTAPGHATEHAGSHAEEAAVQVVASLLTLGGIALAILLFQRRKAWVARMQTAPTGARAHALLFSGWGFDALYDRLFVRPLVWFANINRDDVFDAAFTGLAALATAVHLGLSRGQNGRVRVYAMAIAAGAIGILAILILA